MNGRRYPVEPLERLTGLSHRQLRLLAGMDGSIAYKARPGLTEATADRLAVAAGYVPYDVWPEMLDHAIEDVEASKTFPCAECGTPFAPTSARHRFCQSRCAARNRKRLQYQRDPAVRERTLARAAAYREECRPALIAYKRRYDAANKEAVLARKRERYAARRDEINARRRERYRTDEVRRQRILVEQREYKRAARVRQPESERAAA